MACAWYPWMAWALASFSACVARSRVVLGVHYPSDIAAAGVIGGALGVAALALASWA